MIALDKPIFTSDETKKAILEDKKKLLEIYALVGGLIIASIQNTSSLIAINTSTNESIYINSIIATKAIIGASNLAFFAFIFLLLTYYTKTFDEDPIFTFFLVILISVFFSFILTNFIHLYLDLSPKSFFILSVCIFLAILLTLMQNGILMIIMERELSKKRKNGFYVNKRNSENNLNIQHTLKVLADIWKAFVAEATLYIIFCIFIPHNPSIYLLIFFWTIAAAIALFIFRKYILTLLIALSQS